jgi:hypothetical protein
LAKQRRWEGKGERDKLNVKGSKDKAPQEGT